MKTTKYLTLYQLQMNNKFVDLILSLKKQGGKIYLHGGMIKNRKSKNDIDLYVEGIKYRELPQNINIKGLPVRFALAMREGEPYLLI